MGKYIAILRGINVSGQKLVKMDALKLLMEELNFKNVSTYIQSGNVIFESENNDTHALAEEISEKISQAYGFQVPAIVLSAFYLSEILHRNPFVNENIDNLYVTFLSGQPKQELMQKIEPLAYKPDEFLVMGDTIYLKCSNGYGRTKINNNFFEQKLKLFATTRNWKTVTKLAEFCHQC